MEAEREESSDPVLAGLWGHLLNKSDPGYELCPFLVPASLDIKYMFGNCSESYWSRGSKLWKAREFRAKVIASVTQKLIPKTPDTFIPRASANPQTEIMIKGHCVPGIRIHHSRSAELRLGQKRGGLRPFKTVFPLTQSPLCFRRTQQIPHSLLVCFSSP